MFDGGYYSSRIIEPGAVCPEDKNTLEWQKAGPKDIFDTLKAQQYVPLISMSRRRISGCSRSGRRTSGWPRHGRQISVPIR